MSDRIFLAVYCSIIVHFIVQSIPMPSSYYWISRHLYCEYYGGNNTRCVIKDSESAIEQNPECFEEEDMTNATRVYCALGCDESDEASLVSKKPPNNHQCTTFFTYNLERRRKDWYIWRRNLCVNSTISFEVSCGTPRDPKVFYYLNAHLFEYEDAE